MSSHSRASYSHSRPALLNLGTRSNNFLARFDRIFLCKGKFFGTGAERFYAPKKWTACQNAGGFSSQSDMRKRLSLHFGTEKDGVVGTVVEQ